MLGEPGHVVLTNRAVVAEDPDRSFAVIAPGYWELGPAGVQVIPVSDLEVNRSRLDAGGTMYVVGLSKLLTPSNRVRLGQVLLRPRPGLRRISVDRFMFIGEPWRAFWHLYAVGIPHRGFPDSFLAESRWRDAVARQIEDPFSAEAILASAGERIVRADAPVLSVPDVDWVGVAPQIHDEYAVEKALAFAEETSIQAILQRLGVFAAKALPVRRVPTLSRLFAPGGPGDVVATDLPVDRFLVGRLLGAVRTTNQIATGGAS